jgi:DNA-binding transcriptional LysR family regulator
MAADRALRALRGGHDEPSALRAGLRDGPLPYREFALRVSVAAVENLPPPGSLLRQFTLPALGAGDAGRRRQRLRPLALGETGTAQELTEPAPLDGHRPATVLAGLFEIHLGAGHYTGYRADRLFGVSIAAVANPALVKETGLKTPQDLAHHTLLHDDAMEIVAGGHAWRKWLETAGVADRVDADRGPHFSTNILSLEAASQKLGVALALHPLIDADIASERLCEPFDIVVRPQSAYYLVCPEVIADRPAVGTFRKWLLEQAKNEYLNRTQATAI